jgi:thioredoxin 1
MTSSSSLPNTDRDTAASHAPGAVRVLTDATFPTVIEQGGGVALVDFGADWCPPCRMMQPVVAQIAQRYAGRATIATVDVDTNTVTATTYHARSLPTFLFFVNGEVVDRVVGAVPETRLTARLDALLAALDSPPTSNG